jgi:ABC-type multidrug transport system fused ATPase/permease subunit
MLNLLGLAACSICVVGLPAQNLLFRIIELDSGTICIDGIDIAKLGLKQLRQAISMLPQDPTL